METSEVLADLYGRVPPLAREAVSELPVERLVEAPRPGANPIAWLVWHLARVQDSHVAEVTGDHQLWTTGRWAERFGLEADPADTGYGHTAEQVAGVRPIDPGVLIDYLEAVHSRTLELLRRLDPEDLDRVVDRKWDPPVTLGVRLVSVADDCLQHVGQAAYVRGLLAP
jgi:hypothetical protein